MKTILLFILLLLANGCSSAIYVQGLPRSDQKVHYEKGFAVLESYKTNAVVMRPIYSAIEGKLMFYVVVANLTNNSFDFSNNNITVSSTRNSHNGTTKQEQKSLKLWSKDEIIEKIKRDAFWQSFAVALDAATRSYNASQPSYTTGTGNFSSYGSGGYCYGTFYGQFKTYDPAASETAKALIQAQASSQLQLIASGSAYTQASVQNIVARTTIPPGGYYGGLLVIDPPSMRIKEQKLVTFGIMTNDGIHYFDFWLTKK